MRRGRGKWKRKVWLDERAMSRLLPWQQQLHRPRNRREMQHGECRGEDQGRGGSRCRMSSGGPCVRSAAERHGPGCGGRAARGSRFCLFRGARPPCLRRRHCSLPGPRSGSPPARSLARSTCSLWPRRSRCGMMQSRPLPPLAPGGAPRRGRGGGWSQRGGRRGGSDGNIPRRPGAGPPPPTAPGGARDGGGGVGGAGRARREPRPAPPSGSLRAGAPPGLSAWVGGTARPQWGRPRCLAATGAPALQTAWTGRLPARKANSNQRVPGSRILPAWALRVPGLPCPSAAPEACQTRPRAPASAPFLLPFPPPCLGLVHLTLNKLIPT